MKLYTIKTEKTLNVIMLKSKIIYMKYILQKALYDRRILNNCHVEYFILEYYT